MNIQVIVLAICIFEITSAERSDLCGRVSDEELLKYRNSYLRYDQVLEIIEGITDVPQDELCKLLPIMADSHYDERNLRDLLINIGPDGLVKYLALRNVTSSKQRVIEACKIVANSSSYVDQKVFDYLIHPSAYTFRVPQLNYGYVLMYKILCHYGNGSEYERLSELLGLNMHNYLKFEYVRRRMETLQFSDHVPAARELCKILQSAENVAETKYNETRLTEGQLEQFNILYRNTKTTNTTSMALAYKHLCDFLVGPVLPDMQAKVLDIPVELYMKIVALRKRLVFFEPSDDKLTELRSICQEINSNEKMPDVYREKKSSRDLLRYVIGLVYVYMNWHDSALHNIKLACIQLNETVSVEDIAKHSGLTAEEYEKFESSSAGSTPYIGANELCHIVNPERTHSIVSADLVTFIYGASKIFMLPTADRRSLLREVCTTVG